MNIDVIPNRLEKHDIYFKQKFIDSMQFMNASLEKLVKACVRYFLSNFYFFTK